MHRVRGGHVLCHTRGRQRCRVLGLRSGQVLGHHGQWRRDRLSGVSRAFRQQSGREHVLGELQVQRGLGGCGRRARVRGVPDGQNFQHDRGCILSAQRHPNVYTVPRWHVPVQQRRGRLHYLRGRQVLSGDGAVDVHRLRRGQVFRRDRGCRQRRVFVLRGGQVFRRRRGRRQRHVLVLCRGQVFRSGRGCRCRHVFVLCSGQFLRRGGGCNVPTLSSERKLGSTEHARQRLRVCSRLHSRAERRVRRLRRGQIQGRGGVTRTRPPHARRCAHTHTLWVDNKPTVTRSNPHPQCAAHGPHNCMNWKW